MTNRARREPQGLSAPPIEPTMKAIGAGHGVSFRPNVAIFGLLAISLWYSGVAAAQGNSPTQLRRFIDQQVGGLRS